MNGRPFSSLGSILYYVHGPAPYPKARVLSRLIVLQEIYMFCPFCAVQLRDAPKFCPSCGQNVEFLTQLPSVGIEPVSPEQILNSSITCATETPT
ncbi:unnamed protein product [Boreogadus saida]